MKKYVKTNIGFIINHLRSKKKITSYQMAPELGMSRENINSIENLRSNPSLHNLIKILEYFDCEICIMDKKNKCVGTIKILKDD